MKYLAIASLVALAAANPQWDPVVATTTKAPTTWSELPKTPVIKTKTDTWVEAPVDPKTKQTWSEVPKKADPTWSEWNKKPVYTTTVVTAITTYCPEPTTLVHVGKTYTVTKATTLTITDCPCTISVPVYVKTSTSCAETKTPVKGDEASTWAAAPVKTPVADASTWANAPVKTPVADATTNPTWSPVKSPVAAWTGAANKVNVGAGFGAIIGAAALLL